MASPSLDGGETARSLSRLVTIQITRTFYATDGGRADGARSAGSAHLHRGCLMHGVVWSIPVEPSDSSPVHSTACLGRSEEKGLFSSRGFGLED